MRTFISTFFHDEVGAVTVDFVALTGSICILGVVVVTTFSGSAIAMGNDIRDSVSNMDAGG